MDEEASIILGDAIAFCQRDGQDARLINMLGQSRAVSLTEDTLTIEAPSRFVYRSAQKDISRPSRRTWKRSPLHRLRSTSWRHRAPRQITPHPRHPSSPRRHQLPPQCQLPSTKSAMFPVKPCPPHQRQQFLCPLPHTCLSRTTQHRARIRASQSKTRFRPTISAA